MGIKSQAEINREKKKEKKKKRKEKKGRAPGIKRNMPTSIVVESDLKDCILGSAGFSAHGTLTSVSAVHHYVCGKDRGGFATAGQNARTDKDM